MSSWRRFTALDWLALAVAALIWIQIPAVFLYALAHPSMTGTEVLLAAENWAIPFRWFQ